jgi:hypothetical protein
MQTDAVLEKEKARYMSEMADQQTAFLDHLNSISLEVNGLARFTDLREVDKASSAVTVIKRQLEVRACVLVCMCVCCVCVCVCAVDVGVCVHTD